MHTPVLLNEVLDYLAIAPGKKYIDATVGYAGHALEICKRGGTVLGIERDPEVVADLLSRIPEQMRRSVTIRQGDYRKLSEIAHAAGFDEADGILFDLGMGSHQLDDSERGFAFQKDGPLDMRFDRSNETLMRAGDILNKFSEDELTDIFKTLGEERRFGKKIARQIVIRRKQQGLNTTTELFDLIKQTLPAAMRHKSGDVARKIFQSLRIKVNGELEALEQALPQALKLLGPEGRLVVISFHSLEDRIVKNFMVQAAKDCICPPDFPVCGCDKKSELRILTKKPVSAGEQERERNPRSKSAKLRAAERL